MKIVHFSAECYPFAKAGGLGDVVGALPKYLNQIGHNAAVFLPFYAHIDVSKKERELRYENTVSLADGSYPCSVYEVTEEALGFPLFLVSVEGLTNRDAIYGYEDDPKRFIAFQRVGLQFLKTQKTLPDIIHVHDHHTGLVPFMMTQCPEFSEFKVIPTLLSIHNAQYQGQFPHEYGGWLPEFPDSQVGLLDWDGMINPLATAIKTAWRVTTVSPSYMKELQQHANGLESLLAHEAQKCIGILNGIDAETWNPQTDPFLETNYGPTNFVTGRRANKEKLCDTYGLSPSLPLFGFIGRLVWEKGADELVSALEVALNTLDINVILLGSGDPALEKKFEQLSDWYKKNVGAYIGYKESMSHDVYAAADFLLMPSRVEPCGLNQLYSFRYGCMPIVRKTGGLKDTVIDIAQDGLGITHEETTSNQISEAIERAVLFYQQKEAFRKKQRAMMKLDYSWEHSAKLYASEYQKLIKS
ncbi:glycogen synthase [Altibacter sp. HG106]|uniref:glycogen synthase n=1 Tax=Altibacter sp. HG106 TaxID=3023937 RepID=UPI002350D753|nr:glycogen/starch synthase [Altibacter sp. HG106]MDC7993784.1 glycogen/starch synthase [Altibacter sp. HG106]